MTRDEAAAAIRKLIGKWYQAGSPDQVMCEEALAVLTARTEPGADRVEAALDAVNDALAGKGNADGQ